MQEHDVLELIKQADAAISAEDFDALMEFYADDAVLVVQPGQIARGKVQIRKAFEAIARHFGNTLSVTQGKAQVIEGGDTALVTMETLLRIDRLKSRFSAEPLMSLHKTRHADGSARSTTPTALICWTETSFGGGFHNRPMQTALDQPAPSLCRQCALSRRDGDHSNGPLRTLEPSS